MITPRPSRLVLQAALTLGLLFALPAADALAGVVTGEDDPFGHEPNIPEYAGNDDPYTDVLERTIDISGAPAGVSVISVSVRLDLHHTSVFDLRIRIEAGGRSGTLWENASSGDGDGIHRDIVVADAFDGIDPNQSWTLYIKDEYAGDSGELESWALSITYEDCTSDADCGEYRRCAGGTCVDKSCAELDHDLGPCDSVGSDGECRNASTEVWECVAVGPVLCWELREDCAGTAICTDPLLSAAICIDDGDEDYCSALVAAGNACGYGQSDCDSDGECLAGLDCVGPIGGDLDGCCNPGEEWDGTRCLSEVSCASLGYPLGGCGMATSDGECSDDYGEVWECTDVGSRNCWVLRETCQGAEVCTDPLLGGATCIGDGHEDYCSALVTAGGGCTHGQSDCDNDGQCLGELECMGPVGGDLDGCCFSDEEWDGARCVSADCENLGYPLGPCGLADIDGECNEDYDQVIDCVDVGPANCWQVRETCEGTSVCSDTLFAAAACIDDGAADYCSALVDAGGACTHGQSDCDADGECVGDLVCVGPLGGELDGCCDANESWDGMRCVTQDCLELGYPLGPCGFPSTDGECDALGTTVMRCVDAGSANCWELLESCSGTQVCSDTLSGNAACIDEGHDDYCAALAALGGGCTHGQSDCDIDAECLGDLDCQGPVGGASDGCCRPDEEWDGDECLAGDCTQLGYPRGPCGLASTDGECRNDFTEVWQCIDAGPLNCWSVRESCAGTALCYDTLLGAAGCIDEGDGDYCRARLEAGSGCSHGQSDCDFDSECLGTLECMGPIGGEQDGCCYPGEGWDIDRCTGDEPCEDDCEPTERGCGTTTSMWYCGQAQNDGDPCLEKIAVACEAGELCEDGLCIPDVDCASSNDCPTEQYCGADGNCEPDLCPQGDAYCEGRERRWCNADGSESASMELCEFNCSAGACTDECEDDGDCAVGEHCVPELKRCRQDVCRQGRTFCEGRERRRCDENGSAWEVLELCERGCELGTCIQEVPCTIDAQCELNEYCDNGTCRPDLCPQGRFYCDGNDRRHCGVNGGGSELLETCEFGCDNGQCLTDPAACATDDDCPAAQHCATETNHCANDVCEQGLHFCEGENDRRECNANGSDSHLIETCANGCQGGSCQESACTTDTDCPAGGTCVAGSCQAPPVGTDAGGGGVDAAGGGIDTGGGSTSGGISSGSGSCSHAGGPAAPAPLLLLVLGLAAVVRRRRA